MLWNSVDNAYTKVNLDANSYGFAYAYMCVGYTQNDK